MTSRIVGKVFDGGLESVICLGLSTIMHVATPFVIPSMRKSADLRATYKDLSSAAMSESNITAMSWIVGGVIGLGTDLAAFYHVTREKPALLLIPALTNTISGIYEYLTYRADKTIDNEND
ncbi:MAG: hypothetical protein AABW73_04770 [Nanoarchaeota archaeon]